MESNGVVMNDSGLGQVGLVNSQKEQVQDQVNEGLVLNDLNIYDPSFEGAVNIEEYFPNTADFIELTHLEVPNCNFFKGKYGENVINQPKERDRNNVFEIEKVIFLLQTLFSHGVYL